MSSEPLLILANRRAGALAGGQGGSLLAECARSVGFEPEVIFTRNAAHLRRLLLERSRPGMKVALVGGDGTIHPAVQELAGSDVILGIVPLGTANNFATSLRLPREMADAFRVIAEGEVRAIDLGTANGRYFTEAAGVGLFAESLSELGTGRQSKHPLRLARMLWNVFINYHTYRLQLTVDGERWIEEVSSVTVANTYCLGYNLPIAPEARVTDTWFDIVVIEALSRAEMLTYFRAIRARSHTDLPKVRTCRAREVRIDSRRPRTVHVDDRTWMRTPVDIRIAPGALRVMVERI